MPGIIEDSLSAGMRKRGWTEGGLVIESRASKGSPARALELAKELASLRVELVLALNTANAMAMKQASLSIPIVAWCGYPVEAGLVNSLARPGGNVTGVASYAGVEVWGKFVELLGEMRPALREVGVLWDYTPPGFPDGPFGLDELRSVTRRVGINAQIWTIRSERELLDALSAIERGPVEALLITTGGGIHNQPALSARIGEVVTRRRLPAITDFATDMFVNARCAMAYSPHVPGVVDRLAHFADRILRGAKPAALPFEQPSRFNLVVNLKVAQALGLNVPPTLLARADQVIQ